MRQRVDRDVLLEVGVQREFLAGGVHACENAEQLCATLRRMMAFARWSKAPVISVIDGRAHLDRDEIERDRAILLKLQVPPYGLLPDHRAIESDNCLCVALDLLEQAQQIIFRTNHSDPFTNPKLDRVLTEMPARRYVLFGAPLETTIRVLALGLLRRGRSVTIIHDACGSWSAQEAAMTQRQLQVKNCRLVTASQYIQSAISTPRSRRGRSVA